jgi:peptide/nickel transport system substrate-binding protein
MGPAGRKGFSLVRAATMMIVAGVITMMAFSAVALAQPSPSGSASPANQKTTFIYGVSAPNSSLNPLVGYLGLDYNIWAMEYNLPIEFGTKDFSPDFAHSIVTSVDTSSDNMSFTYHMRSGLKWSDGQPYTANDVAWSLNYYKQQDISNYAADLALVKNVTVTDPTTFVIHSTKPTSVYNGQAVFMYDYILPEHIWSKLSEPKKFDDVPAVGSGPYIVTKAKAGDFVQLERNPNYWGTAVGLDPHVDVIIEKIFNDENQMAAALQRGEIDFIWSLSSANILNTLKTKPNIAVHGAVQPSFEELMVNTGSAFETNPAGGFKPHGTGSHAAADPAFRRALREAVDSQTIVDKVLLGYGTAADSPVQPDAVPAGSHWDPPADQTLSFNLDKAKADLAAAGYKDTDGDGIVNDPVTGKDVVLQYYARTSDQNTIKTAPYVKSWFKQIGVGLNVQAVSDSKATSLFQAGDLDMYDWGWYPNPDPNYILGIFTCAQRPPNASTYANNDSYFCDPQYDKLYQQQLTATSTDQRVAIIQKMQQILYQQQPYLMLYYNQNLEAWRTDRFTGFTPQPSPDGDMLAFYGPFSIINIRPVSATSGQATSSGGIPAWVWLGILLGLVVVVVGIIFGRRRTSDEDRA